MRPTVSVTPKLFKQRAGHVFRATLVGFIGELETASFKLNLQLEHR